MSTYLLVITPKPIPDADYPKAFCRMIGCNAEYEDIIWNGEVSFLKVQVGDLWSSLVQMNDEIVRDTGSLTVVWSANPLNHLDDQDRLLYERHRPAIIKIVDSWAAELGSMRTDALYFDGDVCWVLESSDTDLLNSDFAGAKRSRFTLVNGGLP